MMPIKLAKQFTSWSYSRYRDYTRCPLFAKLKHLDKIPEPPNKAMERGSEIGKMSEDYLLGHISKLPKELSLFKDEYKVVRAMNPLVEQMLCFDKNWSEVAWNDWNNVWVRIKMDLCVLHKSTSILIPIDVKTGKYREYDIGTYLEQLEIYAMGGMCKITEARGASPRLWFLDEGIEYPQNLDDEIFYARSELPLLKKKWEKNIKAMFTDTSFKPKPNNKCQWCPYSKAKGGQCVY